MTMVGNGYIVRHPNGECWIVYRGAAASKRGTDPAAIWDAGVDAAELARKAVGGLWYEFPLTK